MIQITYLIKIVKGTIIQLRILFFRKYKVHDVVLSDKMSFA